MGLISLGALPPFRAIGLQIPMPGEEQKKTAPSDAPFVRVPSAPLPTKVAIVGTGPPLGSRKRSLKSAVTEAIERTHGLANLRPDSRVLLKPAVNSGKRYPATTDPDMISTVIHSLREHGVRRIVVADRSGVWRDTLKCMGTSGIFEAASRAGADILALEFAPWDGVTLPSETSWLSGFRVPRIISEVDFVISLPTLRTHFLADFTLALKNSVGLVDMVSRTHMHLPWGFHERLAEIALIVRPDFFILDARRAFIDGGPDSGREVDGGVIVAGTDPVAVDVVGVALLKQLGAGGAIAERSVWEQRQIAHALRLEIGAKSRKDIGLSIEGVAQSEGIDSFL